MDVEWVKSFAMEAKTDLESAEELLKAEKYGRVTFLAEQCVEKIIKSFLLCRGVEIVKKHDITPLLVDALTEEEIKEFDKLIRYSKLLELEFPRSRYPIPTDNGIFSPARDYTKEDAQDAIKKAGFVYETLTKFMKERYGVDLTELGGILSGMETKPTKEVMKEIKEGWE